MLADAGRRMHVKDLWIAPIGAANDRAVVTQDEDFDVLAELDALTAVKV